MSEIKKIQLSENDIKKESKEISIPSFLLKKFMKTDFFIKDILKDKIIQLFEKAHERLKHRNSLESVNNILSEKLFKEKNLHQAIFSNIENYLKKNNLTLQNLESLEIINGELFVVINNGEKIAFDLSAKSMEELIIKTQTKENLDKTKEEMSTTLKVVMWGSLVTLTYGQFIESGNAIDKKIDAYNMKYGDMKGQKFLTSIEIDNNGEKIKVSIANDIFDDLKNRHMIGEKHILNKMEIFEIIKRDGIKFNYETNSFEKTAERKTNDAVKELEFKDIKNSIKKYSYEEYTKLMEETGVEKKERFTKTEFEKAKIANINLLKDLNSEYNAGKNRKIKFGKFFESKIMGGFFGKVAGKAIHYIMFPIFFKEIQKHSGNLDSYLKGAVEFGAFMTGVKIGSKYMPGPFIVKMIAGLIAGGATAVGGEHLLHNVDKELLSAMPNREGFFERKFGKYGKKTSDWAGWILGGELNDLADKRNGGIGINFNEINRFFYKNWERREWMDVNLWENDINFGSSMIEHMNERTGGKEQWNKEVEEFKIRATQRINTEVLNKNFKYSDVLKNDNTFGLHSFTENLSKGLEFFYNPRNQKGSAGLYEKRKADKNAKKIFEFTEKNLDKNLLLGQFIDNKNISKGKSFDKIKEKLKIFLLKNNILKEEKEINKFVEYYEGVFYNKMDQKIDDILGNPNILESLLQASGDIHNTTKEIKSHLKNSIKKGYFINKINKTKALKTKNNETGEYNMTPIETLLYTEINKLKINDTFINNYEKVIIDDEKLLDKALDGKIVLKNGKPDFVNIGEYTFIQVSQEKKDKEGKKSAEYFKTTGNINDIIYISSMSEKDREFTKKIFKNIQDPSISNIIPFKGGDKKSTSKHDRRNKANYNRNLPYFKELLQNDNYYIFFNRMIDFKRRKYFIENIKKYGDSKEVNEEIVATRKTLEVLYDTDIINTILYIGDKIKKTLKN